MTFTKSSVEFPLYCTNEVSNAERQARLSIVVVAIDPPIGAKAMYELVLEQLRKRMNSVQILRTSSSLPTERVYSTFC